jgi:glycosyltransferase involved in cell wall biosynthesis
MSELGTNDNCGGLPFESPARSLTRLRKDAGPEAMNILIDGYNLGLERGTGIATYCRNLCRMIKSLGGEAGVLYGLNSTRARTQLLSEIAFTDSQKKPRRRLFTWAKVLRDSMTARFGCEVDRIPISGSVILDSLKSRLPEIDSIWNSPDIYRRSQRSFRWFGDFAQVKIPKVDIAHWTYPLPIYAKGARNVYTLHDLVPLRLPQTTLDNKDEYFALCKRLVDAADHIITVSENSRKDIISLLGADPAKVTNTYQPVFFPERLTSKSESVVRNELSGTFNLEYKGYFLFYGAVEPKKNLGRLIEAYLGSAVATPLVIVGAPGWNSKEELRLLEMVKRLGCKQRIMEIEYLPLSMLVTMIRGAKATLFPSLYEGFGLPMVESMLLGTAVLTSNIGSLPEVGGGAACFVDPYDTRSLAEAIRELDVNESLRCELEGKGRIRAEYFSEAACGRRLCEAYKRIVGKNPD